MNHFVKMHFRRRKLVQVKREPFLQLFFTLILYSWSNMVKLHLTNPLFTNNRTPIIEMGQTFDFGRSFWNATVKQRLKIQGLYNLFFKVFYKPLQNFNKF